MRVVRRRIGSTSRANFLLERQLGEIDEKIALLLKNRLSLEEAQKAVSSNTKDADAPQDETLPHNLRIKYEDLLYYLQSQPVYLAKMASRQMLTARETPGFVQCVVFDLFGDQYDAREERLLLNCFRYALVHEIEQAESHTTLLRNNTPVTLMLSAYATRGQGISVLRTVLEGPLRQVLDNPLLNLELHPTKVYNQLRADFEVETGQARPDMAEQVTDEQAAAHPEVVQEVAQRLAKLAALTQAIVDNMVNSVQELPYGMRWICKCLGALCKKRFPEADRYQIGSLIGGYVNLRFFTPRVVNPDFIPSYQKPNSRSKRNLVLVAKTLQNLSNGQRFGDNQAFMKQLNPFIDSNREVLQDYFEVLTAVEDVEESSQLDKYLEHTSETCVRLNLNQIYLLHRLVQDNIDVLCPESEDTHTHLKLRQVLVELQQVSPEPPPQLPFSEDRQVWLQLQLGARKRMATLAVRNRSTIVEMESAMRLREVQAIEQGKKDFCRILASLPHPVSQHTGFSPFFQEELCRAKARGDGDVADLITKLTDNLTNFCKVDMNVTDPADVEVFLDNFRTVAVQNILSCQDSRRHLMRRAEQVNSAHDTIQKHHNYLVSRIEQYQVYLSSIKQGNHYKTEQKSNNKKVDKGRGRKALNFKHEQLEAAGVIASVDEAIPKKILKKLRYSISEVAPLEFQISLFLKAGFTEVGVPNSFFGGKEGVKIQMEDLLARKDRQENIMELPNVQLNVTLLIFFLNKNFVKK